MENNITPQTRVMRELPPEWQHLMQLVEKLGYGEIQIIVKNKRPHAIKNLAQNINLTEPEDFRRGLETHIL